MKWLSNLLGIQQRPKETTTESTVTVDPRAQGMWLDLFNQAGDLGFNRYGGDFASGLTGDEQLGRQQLRNAIGGIGQQGVLESMGMLRGLAGFQPGQVTAGTVQAPGVNTAAFQSMLGDVPQVSASSQAAQQAQAEQVARDRQTLGFRGDIRDVAGQSGLGGVSQWMNPYQQQVIDPALRDIERARQMQINSAGDAAARQGAFGGSRHGLVEAETNRNFAQQAADTAAQLRQSGFNMAAQQAQTDAARAQAAQLANQGVDLGAAQQALGSAANLGLANMQAANQMGVANAQNALQASMANAQNQMRGINMLAGLEQFNAGQGLQSGLANVGNQLRADLSNQQAGIQGANLGLGAAGQLGQFGNMFQNMQTGLGGMLSNLGQQERGIADRNLAGQYQEFMRQQQFPWQQLQMQANLLGQTPWDTTTTNVTQQQQYRSPLGDALSGAVGGSVFGPIGGIVGGLTGLFGL